MVRIDVDTTKHSLLCVVSDPISVALCDSAVIVGAKPVRNSTHLASHQDPAERLFQYSEKFSLNLLLILLYYPQ
jgi:hypothetical protein